MKLISTLVVVFVVTGCTTMKPVELSPDQLHGRISAGEVIHVGDSVKIVTSNGEHLKFKVTSITDENVVGKEIQVPITNIVAIQTKEFSGGKTALLVGGSAMVYALIGAVALSGFAVGL